MRLNDAVFGVLLVLLGAFIINEARGFPDLPGQSYGPAFFPNVIGASLAVCGVALIVAGIAQRHELAFVRLGAWASSPRHVANVVLVLVALVAYILFSDTVGFVPMSFVILGVLLYRFGCGVATTIGLAVGATLLIHTLFYKFLLVPLPWGVLEPYAW
jgi:putative tricarboxylic transport membrane protein